MKYKQLKHLLTLKSETGTPADEMLDMFTTSYIRSFQEHKHTHKHTERAL